MSDWNFIESYFINNKYYFTKHHLDSFNDFVKRKIPHIISSFNPLILQKPNVLVNIYVGGVDGDEIFFEKPFFNNDTLYPNMARLHNLSYLSKIFVNIHVEYNIVLNDKIIDTITHKFDKQFIGSIPIMLHSNLCILENQSKKDMIQLGECPYDQGGYFIIDGKEKVLISQERIAPNQLFVTEASDPDFKLEGKIVSTSKNDVFPKTVHLFTINKYLDKKSKDSENINKNLKMKRQRQNYILDDSIVVRIMNIKMDIPICVLFRALGVESDKDILTHIFNDINDGRNKDAIQFMRNSIVSGSDIYTQSEALNYISNFTEYKSINYVKRILVNDLFSNIEYFQKDTNKTFKLKALYLGYIVNKLINTSLGYIQPNDRDNYMYKRVDVTGVLLSNIFKDFYASLRRDVLNKCDQFYNKYFNGVDTNIKNVVNMINKNNINHVFSYEHIVDGMMKSFKGNWGLLNDETKQGYVQDLSRLSYIGYVSHVRRVNTPIDRDIKLVGPHRLGTSQWGYMCPIESPDGGNIGLLKHMAVTCNITPEHDDDDILQFLKDIDSTFIDPNFSFNFTEIYKFTKIFLNNNWVALHKSPLDLYNKFIHLRRTGNIYIYASISWNVFENEIKIFTDAGRCIRPLYISNNIFNNEQIDFTKLQWNNETIRGLHSSKYKNVSVNNFSEGLVEFIDVHESNTQFIAMNKSDATNQHSHVEIHPSLALSLYTNTIPFANHNQAPRNIFSGQQGKQAIGVYATNFNSRIDTASYLLHYPQKSLVDTKLSKYVYKDKLPNGENLIVAVATYTGYNQEDSIIINENSIKRGMFNVSSFKSYVDKEEFNENSNEEVLFQNPEHMYKNGKKIIMKKAFWDNIDKNGHPKINTFMEEGDVFLGKVYKKKNKLEDATGNMFNTEAVDVEYSDKSVVASKTLYGTIDTVYSYKKNDFDNIKIKIRKFRTPVLGDKLASMHGQKGVVGMIIPQENMPFNKDGLVPDIIVNPHAFPSRMTISHMIECVLSKLCCVSGAYIDGTIFEKHDFESYYDILEKYGYQRNANELLYNGLTGEQMSTEIFIGPTYYYRLKHMVQDKINYRDSGPLTSMTRQPTQGRANGGGLRIGEMETNAILAHGISAFIKESLSDRSDQYDMFVDNQNSDIAISNKTKKIYKAANSDNNTNDFSRIQVPYSVKLLSQEINAMGLNMNIVTNKDIADKMKNDDGYDFEY